MSMTRKRQGANADGRETENTKVAEPTLDTDRVRDIVLVRIATAVKL